MVETIGYVYTTEAEMLRKCEQNSLGFMSDLDGSGTLNSTVVDDSRYEATDTINMHCEPFYAAADMVNNRWIRNQATWLALYFLSRIDGEPGILDTMYTRIMEYLDRVNQGKMFIPRLATRADMVPCVTNYVIDDQFARQKVRVARLISTGDAYSGEKIDLEEYVW